MISRKFQLEMSSNVKIATYFVILQSKFAGIFNSLFPTKNEPSTNSDESQEDCGWLDSDLSNLGSWGAYELNPDDIETLEPVCYIPGQGLVANS